MPLTKDVSLRKLLRLRHARYAWLVLGAGLLITAACWAFSVQLVKDRTEARFETQSRQLKTAIEERILNYEQVLAGSAGLFAVSDQVSREDWQLYVERVDIDRYYPGIQGIGVTQRVQAGELVRHMDQVRAQGLSGYFIYPLHDGDEYHPIIYLEPATRRNQLAFGYDAASEPAHRRAMDRARDTATPTMTGKVVLVQEEVDEEQASFLMYYPVYEGNRIPESVEARRAALEGFVFSAFRMNNLIDGIVGLISPFLDVRIYDGEAPVPSARMYGSNLGSLDNDATFTLTQPISHGGRTWLLETHTTPAFDYLAADPRPLIVLVAGALVSVLLFAFSLLLARSRLMTQMNAGRFRAITEGASNITLVLAADGRPTYASPSCQRILGFAPEDVSRMDLESYVHQDDWPRLQSIHERALNRPGKAVPVIQTRVRAASGQWREMDGTCTGMPEEPGVNGVVLALHDTTELREARSELHRLAFYDSLTGLANRQLFRERLQHLARSTRRNGTNAALMLLDLDGFKKVNDTLGHDSGDRLLVQVAQMIQETVAKAGTVARLSGDEFVVLLPSIGNAREAAAHAERLLNRLSQTVSVNGHQTAISASIGVTLMPQDADDPSTLLKYADLAMYQAKERGRNNVQFFTSLLNVQAARRLNEQEELSRAVQEERFVLYYQPRFDLERDAIVGLEALLRWQHPERGLIPAQQFMPQAEDCGLAIPLGELLLRQACIQIQALERAGFNDLRVAVKLCAAQVTDVRFADSMRQIITETGVTPERLELEWPAELFGEDSREVRELAEGLSDLGIHLAIADLAGSACSLEALQGVPLEAAGIDQRFIREIPYSRDASEITAAAIAMAHKLRLRVLAHGIETPQQLSYLRALGCGHGQGNLFSNPLNEDALIGFLVRQHERALIG